MRAYARERAALGDQQADQPSGDFPTVVSPPPEAPSEMMAGVLANLAEYEPGEVEALKADWPGAEMGRNIGHTKWLMERRYLTRDLIEEVPDSVGMVRIGATVARQVYAEVNAARSSERHTAA